MTPNVVGKWGINTSTLELRDDGSYLASYDPPSAGKDCILDGSYVVTLGTRFGHGRRTSATGYFLELNPRSVPGRMHVPMLYQIEACDPQRLVVSWPSAPRKGEGSLVNSQEWLRVE